MSDRWLVAAVVCFVIAMIANVVSVYFALRVLDVVGWPVR